MDDESIQIEEVTAEIQKLLGSMYSVSKVHESYFVTQNGFTIWPSSSLLGALLFAKNLAQKQQQDQVMKERWKAASPTERSILFLEREKPDLVAKYREDLEAGNICPTTTKHERRCLMRKIPSGDFCHNHTSFENRPKHPSVVCRNCGSPVSKPKGDRWLYLQRKGLTVLRSPLCSAGCLKKINTTEKCIVCGLFDTDLILGLVCSRHCGREFARAAIRSQFDFEVK